MKWKIETIVRTVDDLRTGADLNPSIDYAGHATRDAGTIAAFASNPNLSSGSQPAEMIGIIDGHAFGSIRTMPMKMVADGRIYETSANPGMAVDKHYRKTGYAIELGEFGPKASKDRISLDFYVSQKARSLAAALGGKVFSISQFALVRKSAIFFRNRVPEKVAPLACLVLDGIFLVHRIVLGTFVALKTRGWKFECADSDADLDEFASLIANDGHRFRHVEDRPFLRWVLSQDFAGINAVQKHLWRVTRSGMTLGFVLTRRENKPGGRARVLDWQMTPGHDRDLVWLLLAAAFRLVRECGAVVLSISCRDVSLVRSLARCLPRIPVQAAVVGSGDGPLRQHAGWDDQSNWRIRPTMGDSCMY